MLQAAIKTMFQLPESGGSGMNSPRNVAKRNRHPSLIWTWIVFLASLVWICAAKVQAGDIQEPFRVMMLRNTSQYLPATILQDEGLREAFAARGGRNVEFFVETMDTMWFDRSRIEPEFLSLFRKKYAHRKIDLLMAAGADALDFAERFHETLLPGVPVAFYNVAEDAPSLSQLRPGIAGALLRFDLRGTLALAMRLQPSARRIVVVSGTSPYDRNWLRRARESLRAYEGKFEVSYWSGLPLQQVLGNLRRLSRDTIVLYLAYSDDGAAHTYAPADLARAITAASAAPVYGVLETYLGQGIVGGSFPSFEAHGKLAGEIARRMLSGDKPESIGVKTSPLFAGIDWRELRRWGISESRVPAGSVIRFRSPTIWDEYRAYIIVTLALIVIEGVLIAGLLLQRRRRRRAEADLRDTKELMELSTSAGELGLWSRSLEGDEMWANARLRSLFGFGERGIFRLEDMISRIHPDDRARVVVEVDRAHRTGKPFEDEFRIVIPDGGERWIATKGRTVAESKGKGPRRMGVMFDVTQRKRAEEAFRESEARFRTMANTAPVMIWMSGPDKLCTFFNNGWLDFTGRTLEKELGNGWSAGVHREDLVRCLDIYASSFDARQEFTIEYRLRRHDGEYRWVLDKGVPRFEPDGTFLGYIGSCLDITDRRRAEQDLGAALAEIRSLKERLEEENIYLKEEISEVKGFDEIIGKSDALRYVLNRVEQVAKTDVSVLLQGETGVGKELIAQAIHEKSSRSNRPLVKVNCATLPETLVESELFGHEKGAFTGADHQRKGRFELADGGTILLDEVGELPAGTQAKLLRVLQEGEFERVGGSSTIKVSVRVIAATNRKLDDEISAGRFRQDLFYRLNVYPITIPPLRQRREDILLLVSHYAREFGARLGKIIHEVPAQVMREFTEYNWPGNIRELQNVIERAVIISSDGVLRLPEPLGLGQKTPAPASESKTPSEAIKFSTLDEAEREHILRALETTGWRINGPKGAAAMLKLHPSTLRFRMKKLGLTKISYTATALSQKSNLH